MLKAKQKERKTEQYKCNYYGFTIERINLVMANNAGNMQVKHESTSLVTVTGFDSLLRRRSSKKLYNNNQIISIPIESSTKNRISYINSVVTIILSQ